VVRRFKNLPGISRSHRVSSAKRHDLSKHSISATRAPSTSPYRFQNRCCLDSELNWMHHWLLTVAGQSEQTALWLYGI